MSAAQARRTDGVAGVAPDASVISIRQSSRAFEPTSFGSGDIEARKKAGTVSTLARLVGSPMATRPAREPRTRPSSSRARST